MCSRQRSRPSSKRRLVKKEKPFSSSRTTGLSTTGVVDELKLITKCPVRACGAVVSAAAAARIRSGLAGFLIRFFPGPIRQLKPPEQQKFPREEGMRASAPSERESWQPGRRGIPVL